MEDMNNANEGLPISLWTTGPLGSRLNQMPDEDFPNEDDSDGSVG
jgi:hypothetical protein